jgi:pyruvate ferredoxin oxidoreductase gamma subunit
MYRIRMHGRGGQGMKTASRILGTAFFREGFEVQDAPRYGAERRGAPMFAYVRADRKTIYERGIIAKPDLVVVSDDSLIAMATAGVLTGLTAETPLLICSNREASFYLERYDLKCQVIVFRLPPTTGNRLPRSSSCAGAAAALLGMISPQNLNLAVAQELSSLPHNLLAENQQAARTVFDKLQEFKGIVKRRATMEIGRPQWLDLPLEAASIAAPIIHAPASSLKMNTGVWRTLRPTIDLEECIACGQCNTYCPDNAISLNTEGKPTIDYDHCKGCLICLAQCPAQAITAQPEQEEVS